MTAENDSIHAYNGHIIAYQDPKNLSTPTMAQKLIIHAYSGQFIFLFGV